MFQLPGFYCTWKMVMPTLEAVDPLSLDPKATQTSERPTTAPRPQQVRHRQKPNKGVAAQSPQRSGMPCRSGMPQERSEIRHAHHALQFERHCGETKALN